MKILLVSTFDKGGAGIACIRLHLALLKLGMDVDLVTLNKSRNDVPRHYQYNSLSSPNRFLRILNSYKFKISLLVHHGCSHNKIRKLIKSISGSVDYFSLIDSPYRIESIPNIEHYDVINLHWVADFINWSSFFSSKNIRNVIWSLHDMNPFTGGYHYSMGYVGFQEFDLDPPFLKGSSNPLLAFNELKRKLDVLRKSDANIQVVCLSNWLCNLSRQSSLFGKMNHRLIPNGLDVDIFNVKDQLSIRKRLGLPLDKKILLFVSDNLGSKRKGFQYLKEALYMLNDDSIYLCCVGNNDQGDDFHYFGRVSNESSMAEIYNCADLFVLPSVEDNLPNVIVESLCCGTPVVAFSIGGMKDLIENKDNGLLCDQLSSISLRDSIIEFFDLGVRLSRFEISNAARKKFNDKNQANLYVSLYRDIYEANF